MGIDLSGITVAATKPTRKIAQNLRELGIRIVSITEDEGNVDRYVLSKRLVVERRTGSGFVTGIVDKTLFTSAIYLREHFRIPVLIVEGRVNYEYSMMDPQAVRGAMSSMLLQYGISVLATENADETAALISMMARQEQIGIPEISLVAKRKATSLDDMQRRVIEMLPGCGMVLARELLQHFGSVRRIANATEAELLELPGVGTRKAKTICNVLSAEYASVDTEKQLETAIEADPRLLFARPVRLLARQHHIYTEDKERHIVDMVFEIRESRTIVLVELKRVRLAPGHMHQLCRYMEHAHESALLRRHLANGASLQGILASVEPSTVKTPRDNVEVRIVDREPVVAVLQKLRRKRWRKRR